MLVNTTNKMCDCGSVIAYNKFHNTEEKVSKKIASLEQKGWSKTKIGNWLNDKKKTDNLRKDRTAEFIDWVSLLNELIVHQGLQKIGMFIHWYKGSLEEETLTFSEEKKIELSQINEEAFKNIDYDIFVSFYQTKQYSSEIK